MLQRIGRELGLDQGSHQLHQDRHALLRRHQLDHFHFQAPHRTFQNRGFLAELQRGNRLGHALGVEIRLERFDHGAEDSTHELSTRLDEALLWLHGALPREDIRVTAGERLKTIAGNFREGPLWQQFLDLDGSILARELALITTPETGGPVGAMTGAIDLVYQDPDTGEIVVADYKTDQLADDAEIQDRAAIYKPQLEIYACALQEAMNLDVTPRQELWFVGSGVVHCLREA